MGARYRWRASVAPTNGFAPRPDRGRPLSPSSPESPDAPSVERAPAPSIGGGRGRAAALLKLALFAAPAAWIAPRLHGAALAEALARGGVRACGLSFAALVCVFGVGAIRWRGLLAAYGAKALPSLASLMQGYFVGVYFGVLPTGMAGDLMRARRVQSFLASTTSSYAIVLVERALGLMGLLLLAAAGIALTPGHDGRFGLPIARAVVATLLGLVVLAWGPRLLVPGARVRQRLDRVERLRPVLAWLPAAPPTLALLRALLLSMGAQAMKVAAFAAVLAPMLEPEQLARAVMLLPLVVLATAIPLVPGGFGQREVAFAYVLAFAGVTESRAVAAALLYEPVALAVVAIGGTISLLGRPRAA